MINEVTPREANYLRAVFDSLAEGVVVANREGRFLLFNAQAERILGIGARDVDPTEWTEAYGCYLADEVTPFPADRLPLARASKGEVVSDEVIFIRNPRRPAGVWISTSSQPLRNDDGTVWGAMVVIRDITDSTLAKRRLQSTASRFSALVESQQAAVLIESENRKIVSANQAFCSLFNIPVPPSQLFGADCSQAAEQVAAMFREPEAFVRRTEQLVRAKTVVMNEELRLVDGRVFECDYIPVFVEDECRGHVWQYRDITERRRARQSIRTYERLSTALEQTADSVVITDNQGMIEYVNPAFETTTGYRREEVLGKTPRILKSGMQDAEFYRGLWTKVLAGQPFRGTLMNRKKTGELYWAEQTITPMRNEQGRITHFVSVLKDITELLETKEQQLKMRLAREIQQRFYGATASLPGFDIGGAAHPADETGGDYFDFVAMPDGKLMMAIGDVSGHGIGAAVMMAATRAYVRAFAAASPDPAEILLQVNRALLADLDEGSFVTMLLCCLDPHRRTLHYASAGHVPGFLVNGSGEVDITLGGTGPPLGLFSNTVFSSGEVIALNAGHILLLTTDGVPESGALDDTPFGLERTIKYVDAHRKAPSGQIADGLCLASRSHAADRPQQDDITSIIVKVL
jgi:sigma-B regulation protein RsbU (phosphoserine phosphatase)